jgi:hypothetical protein
MCYLAIRHEIKVRYDWGWPLVLTAVTMFVFWVLPVRPHVLGEDGVLKGVREFIVLLAAFFVVALAAVATFALETLDRPMQGTTPTLYGRDLTRRQFVCYLFGYLCVLSFALFLGCVAAQVVVPSLRVELSARVFWWVKATAGSIFTFGFWNMIVTTLLGIYFLVERVHLGAGDTPREDRPKLIRGRDAA